MKMKLKIREPTSAWRRRNWTLEVPTGMDHGFLEYEQACIFAVMRQWLVVHTFQNRWREVQGALKYMSDSCWHKCHNTMKHMYVYIYIDIYIIIYIYTHKYVYTVYTHTILWSTLGYAGSCHPNLLKSLWHLHHVAPQFASFPVKSHPPCSIGCKQFVTNFTCLLAECYSIRE